METFRNLMRGWLGKVLMVLFLAPMAFLGIEGYFSHSSQDTVVTINGEKISKNQLDEMIKSQTSQLLQTVGGDQSLINRTVIEKQVYDGLITRTLLLQQAKKLKLSMSEEQLGALIRQQEIFQENGKFSDKAFQNYLVANNLNVDGALQQFEQRQILSLLASSILNTSIYSPTSQQNLFTLIAQTRDVHVAELSLDQFAKNFVASDAQVKAYYEQNLNQFMRQADVDVKYVVMSPTSNSNVTITDEQIQNEYQQFIAEKNKNADREVSQILITTEQHSPEEALKIVQTIQNKLKSGESFENLAKQYSEDPVSKSAQGKVSGYALGLFGNDFDNAVLALKKNEVSAPIKTKFGYHLIRLDNISVSIPALENVRNELISKIKQKNVENNFREMVSTANDLAVQSDSIEVLAQQYKLQIHTVNKMTGNTKDPILSNHEIKQQLFSTKISEGNYNISSSVSLKNGDVVWFKVSQYRPAGQQSLAEAKQQILQILKHNEQVKQAKASITQLLTKFNSMPAQQAINGSNLTFKSLGNILRLDNKAIPKVQRAAFSVVSPKAGYWSVTTTDDNNHLYIVAVSNIGISPELNNLDDNMKKSLTQKFDPRNEMELNDYVEYLKSKAKIKKHEQN